MQFVMRGDDSRSIGEYNLKIISVHNSANTMTRSLCFGSDDTQLLPYQCIHQRGFPNVRLADNIYETRFVHCAFLTRILFIQPLLLMSPTYILSPAHSRNLLS